MATHLLFESAVGYALFSCQMAEEIGQRSKAVQEQIADLSTFGKMVKLISFLPFRDAAHALENANDVSEGVVNDHLRSLLELNLPSKKTGVILGVSDRQLATSIKSTLDIACDTSERSLELIRGIRLHAEKLLKGLEMGDVSRSQLGLGHAYSRGKVKFNVNRSDNMIIQAIAMLDQLDKDVNTFAMRVREWYGWHFPELVKIVGDNYQYAKCVVLIQDKNCLRDKSKEEDLLSSLTDILDDDSVKAKNVIDAGRASMGSDISPIDLTNVINFAERVISIFAYRKSLQTYLNEKMSLVAPNLASLIGDVVGARLISHAGSLTNLSKYPASTVQILGAEKALFRALKTKGNTPKYGLIYNSTFIGRAASKNKGRISRFLANKCSIASRIDCFSDTPTTKFGEALKGQVEERLAFYQTGSQPTKNSAAMASVIEALRAQGEDGAVVEVAEVGETSTSGKNEKKSKKRKSEAVEGGAADVTMEGVVTNGGEVALEAKEKKSKKSKKSKTSDDVPTAPLSAAPPATTNADESMALDAESKKEKKKKRKSEAAQAIAGDASVADMTVDASEADISTVSKKEKKDKKKKRKSEAAA
ncbi:Nop-domain-containing protein [Cystobasidium minutum MCA 4210]|uniref:Nop-domain-containing protein n=1 Tax=Cystobasidium minutum MCA 4210 TaxID=1397322 RepID=UPI0034CF9937|eukprot:jgi/Rhomi1/170511/fgenesh1_kg.4_\